MAQRQSPDNLVMVFTDQQRQNSIGAYGNEFVDTPNIDQLAGDGTRFDNAYTPAAICSPSRASLVTGVRPHKHGITRNVEGDSDIHERFPCYPQRLRDGGYNVGLAGKWHLGVHPREFGFDGDHLPGWYHPLDNSAYHDYLEERGYPPLSTEHLTDAFPDDGEVYQSGAVDTRPVEASFTRFITERAIEMIEDYGEEYPQTPFCLNVHYFGPHNPYYLPEEYLNRYDPEDIELPESAIKETFEHKPWAHMAQHKKSRLGELSTNEWKQIIAAYHGWVTFIDDEVGCLLDALEENGLRDDTGIVYTTDHGGFVTGHKMHDKGPAMYEDIYNIPLITENLGLNDGVDDRFVSLLDLAPTFLEIADVQVPDVYDGMSLYEDGDEWRETITAEFHGHQFEYEQRMIRADDYKLVLNEYDTAEFYDLDCDPHELTNQIANPEYGRVIQDLHERLRSQLFEDGDSFFEGPARKLSRISDVGLEPYDQ